MIIVPVTRNLNQALKEWLQETDVKFLMNFSHLNHVQLQLEVTIHFKLWKKFYGLKNAIFSTAHTIACYHRQIATIQPSIAISLIRQCIRSAVPPPRQRSPVSECISDYHKPEINISIEIITFTNKVIKNNTRRERRHLMSTAITLIQTRLVICSIWQRVQCEVKSWTTIPNCLIKLTFLLRHEKHPLIL